LKTSDLIDPVTNTIQPGAQLLDFPASIVGLLKGDLGFPHRGFPAKVEELILRGESKRTTRAGLVLPAVDFTTHREKLCTQWNEEVSYEEAMSELMYPQVFADYMKRRQDKGPLLTYLPSVVYLYAMLPNDEFIIRLPAALLPHILSKPVPPVAAVAGSDDVLVKVECQRVTAIAQGRRTVHFQVTLLQSDGMTIIHSEHQTVDVKDSGGVFVFDGAMADVKKPMDQIASPMAGIIEKVLITPGQQVQAGDVLCTVSAMKMEVKVSAPRAGIVQSLAIPAPGYRVVEGALLVTLK
jgi:pyruvate carboxylase